MGFVNSISVHCVAEETGHRLTLLLGCHSAEIVHLNFTFFGVVGAKHEQPSFCRVTREGLAEVCWRCFSYPRLLRRPKLGDLGNLARQAGFGSKRWWDDRNVLSLQERRWLVDPLVVSTRGISPHQLWLEHVNLYLKM